MNELDLHWLTREQAQHDLRLFLLNHTPPMQIITGKSKKMVEMVAEELLAYNHKVAVEDSYQQGSVIIMRFKS